MSQSESVKHIPSSLSRLLVAFQAVIRFLKSFTLTSVSALQTPTRGRTHCSTAALQRHGEIYPSIYSSQFMFVLLVLFGSPKVISLFSPNNI